MKSIRSLLPSLSPCRGSIFTRGLAEAESEREFGCFVDILRPRDDVDPLVVGPLTATFTNGCTVFSCPGAGPVDLMKSAKSRIDSLSMRGSLASGLDTTFLLGDGLCCATVGPLVLEAVLLGKFPVPNWLSSALTRGYTVTVGGATLTGSACSWWAGFWPDGS